MRTSETRKRMRYLPASGPLAISLMAVAVTHHIHFFRPEHPWLSWMWSGVLTFGLAAVTIQFVADMRAVRAGETQPGPADS